jgi:DNA-binding XRE family transcriptional regulator
MDGALFSRLRAVTHKSQKDMAAMLGISRKAVESYEQGWRKIPATVERMLYYIAFKLNGSEVLDGSTCWEARACSDSTKTNCPAWVSREGRYCWFITGRLCAAARAASDPDTYCFECPVFTRLLNSIFDTKTETTCL